MEDEMRILVLGAGLVGGPMAVDLVQDEQFAVAAVDTSETALDKLAARDGRIELLQRDLSDATTVRQLAARYDLVLSAVPGFMGFQTLEAVLQAGRPAVDIAFFPEEPFALSSLAERQNVTAVVDCGVAPGLSNLLVGHVDRMLDATETVLIYVGGLPERRTWPFEYKAVYSPADVIEVYTRPARYLENGVAVTRPALSDAEILDFPGAGTLEAFNTDGLRTLATTIGAPNMKEKTLRYLGHINKIAVLRDSGFFDREEVEVDGSCVRPLDFTSRLLAEKWKLEEGDADLTVMRVLVEGWQGGVHVSYRYDLFDRHCEATGVSSMARTTGYTATMVVRLLAAGLFDRPGVFAPEQIGRSPACVEFVLRGLQARGVRLEESIDVREPERAYC
jgi:saccharopine dehydrogenase-like NADP-dependent oxidoreductase